LKRIEPATKIVFMSGYTGDIILDKGVKGETIDFISKPLTPHGLLAKLREVLDR
jgi:FixJ family two-component response regulator